MNSLVKTVGKAFAERATGDKPNPFRAIVVATITGVATAALTYRVLRSGDG
jgi:hypothetical protein